MNYNLFCPICNTNLKDFNIDIEECYSDYGIFYCKCPPTKDYVICSGIYIYINKDYYKFEFCFKDTDFTFKDNNLIVGSLKPYEFKFITLYFNVEHLFDESMYNRNYLSLDYVHDLYQIVKKIENNMVFA